MVEKELIVDLRDGVLRSCCRGTLALRMEQLDAALAVHNGRVPPSTTLLKGDSKDICKLTALKMIAHVYRNSYEARLPTIWMGRWAANVCQLE